MTNVALMCVTAALAAAPSTQPAAPSSLDLAKIRASPAQHDGRWPPVDTVARTTVESVTGDIFFGGHDPVLLLLAWTFDAKTWRQKPLISIANAELRHELQLSDSQTVFSYAELMGHTFLRSLIAKAANVKGRKLDPLESKVRDIDEKLGILGEAFAGRTIKAVPDAKDPLGAWRAIKSSRAHGHGGGDNTEVTQAWSAVRKAFLADDAPGFGTASEQLATALSALPAGHRPDPARIATELRYNKLRPFRRAWIVMLAGALLATGAMFVRKRWFDLIAMLALVGGFGLLTYGLSLRWQIAGRIPAANMFESLLFLSWGMGAFAIVAMLLTRQRIVPLTASAMGALALILADCLPINHYIRPIAPVLLDTVWMSIHVPVIMVSYSVLALAVLIAHVQLVIMAAAPAKKALIDTVDSLHYWYVHVGAVLLLAGIVTGSMWAASSWGRYWGWDPKEVWSLVAFLGYLAILHVRADRMQVPRWAYAVAAVLLAGVLAVVGWKLAPLTTAKLASLAAATATVIFFVLVRTRFATAVKSIVAFWLIIMTYVGVNYVLGIGLHSYGFGTGAVVHYLFWTGGIDLAFVAVCSLIYVIRSIPAGPRRPGPERIIPVR